MFPINKMPNPKVVKLQNTIKKLLPTDEEVAEWFDENIGHDPDNKCSPGTAIYKFRVWLKERAKIKE